MLKIRDTSIRMFTNMSCAAHTSRDLRVIASKMDYALLDKTKYRQTIHDRKANKVLFGLNDGHTWYFANRITQFYDVIPQLVSRVLAE